MHSLLPFVVALSLAAQAPPGLPPVPTLPAAALASADRGPLALATRAGRIRHPRRTGHDQPDRDPGSAGVTADSPPVEGAAVARRLEDRYPPYAVNWRGVMGIEPGQSVCGERLTGMVGPVTVEGQASHLLVVLGWLASGDKPPVHAGVVSRIGQDPTDLAPPAPAPVAAPLD